MPGFDGTGPRGMGPMTGGGRGFCSPWGIRATVQGCGIPPRIGYGYPYYSRIGIPYPSYGAPTGVVPSALQMTKEQELDFLKNQANAMKSQLEQIEARACELETKEK